MMNTYHKMASMERKDQIAALDAATNKKLYDDVLFSIAQFLPEKDTVVVETVKAVKMQPRDPYQELRVYAKMKWGFECMKCSTTCYACCQIPVIAVGGFIGMAAFTVVSSLWLCMLCAKIADCGGCVDQCENTCGVCCDRAFEYTPDCAKVDYRLNRSKCHDLAHCCYQSWTSDLLRFGSHWRESVSPDGASLNGPEAMFME